MGGLGFIIATIIGIAVISGVYLYFGREKELLGVWLTLALALLNGLIGFFDDYTKLIKKQNQGFLAWQKLLLQLLVSAAYLWAMSACGFIDTALEIPYFDIELELGIFYYFFAILFISGMVNSVNLTDGIDGLCSSVSAVVGAFFAVVAFIWLIPELAIFPATIIGGTVGFLMYNFYPAKIFMGDTGSLYLGGAVVGMAFLINEPLIIMVAGIIYLVEVASVILQVGYFKITHGKRIFKMAPIHHHFEKCGWSEVKIVGVFTLITAIACVLAYLGL
jgi:phospho-N-acetylmuramoyl-pentapeptide-transferase